MEYVYDTAGGVANTVNAVITVNAALSISIQPTTNAIDQGQSVKFFNTTSGGTKPFYFVYNVFQFGVAAFTGNYAIAGNTITFSANTGTYNVMEYVYDTAGGVANTVNAVITVNAPLSISIQPTTNAIDQGQSVKFFNTTSGGTKPFYFVYNVFQFGVAAFTGNYAIAGNTITFSANTGTYNVMEYVYDTAGGVANTVNAVITVNAPLSISIQPTTNAIDQGQSVKFFNTTSGGTKPFYFVYNVFQFGVAAFTGNYAIAGNTITFSANTGTYNVMEYVYDTAGGVANTVNAVITVNAALSISIQPTTNAIDQGQSVKFFNTTSGGTKPFYFVYNVFQFGVAAFTGNYAIAGNTITFSANTGTYNVMEYVYDTAGGVANTVNAVITVNAALSISIQPTTNAIDQGQSVKFFNTTSGGTKPFYFVYNVFQFGVAAFTGNYAIAGNTITFSANTGTYNVMEYVYDTAGGVANTVNAVITVNAALSISIQPTTNAIDQGQSVKFFNTTSGGTKPFYFVYNVFQFGVAAFTGNYAISGNRSRSAQTPAHTT